MAKNLAGMLVVLTSALLLIGCGGGNEGGNSTDDSKACRMWFVYKADATGGATDPLEMMRNIDNGLRDILESAKSEELRKALSDLEALNRSIPVKTDLIARQSNAISSICSMPKK